MKNQLITFAAYVAAFTTVFIERVLMPSALLLLRYIETVFTPAEVQPLLAVVPATPVTVTEVEPAQTAAPKKRAVRKRATKAATSAPTMGFA